MGQEVTVHEMGIMELGNILAQSGYFNDAKQAAQAVVKVLAGRELGFAPIASMTGIHIISGKPIIGADMMAKAIKRSGKYNYRVLEITEAVCRIEFQERDGDKWIPVGVSEFTDKDLLKAESGSAVAPGKQKNMRERFPRNMLFSRCISNGVKWFAPDALGLTTYTTEEFDEESDADPQKAVRVRTVDGEVDAEPVYSAYQDNQFSPMTTDELKRWLWEYARDNDCDELSSGWKKAILHNIAKMFGFHARDFLADMFNVESSAGLSNRQWCALQVWLAIKQDADGEWKPSNFAIEDSKLWLAAQPALPEIVAPVAPEQPVAPAVQRPLAPADLYQHLLDKSVSAQISVASPLNTNQKTSVRIDLESLFGGQEGRILFLKNAFGEQIKSSDDLSEDQWKVLKAWIGKRKDQKTSEWKISEFSVEEAKMALEKMRTDSEKEV